MANMPDWLGNLLATTPHLVQDSPQYRADQQQTQLANLKSAAHEAGQALTAQTQASHAQTILHQKDMLDRMTPVPTPLAGPDQPLFAPTDPTQPSATGPTTPGPSDFAPPSASPPGGPPSAPDQATEIQNIAQATGIPPQTVAAMATLGGDIGKLEQARGPVAPAAPAGPPPVAPLAGPPGPSPMPPTPQMPPQGPPPAAPAPLMGPGGPPQPSAPALPPQAPALPPVMPPAMQPPA